MAKVDGIQFAELKPWEVCYIENLEVDQFIITGDQVREAKSVLQLNGMDEKQLNAMRNSIVKHLSELSTAARVEGDWAKFDKFHSNMSALTAVIDNMLYCIA